MKKIFLIVFICFLNSVVMHSQIIHKGVPYSSKHETKDNIPYISLPEFDPDSLISTEAQTKSPSAPMKFARLYSVDYSPENIGIWTTLQSGDKIWQLGITSNGAYSLSVKFSPFFLPEGATLFIYNPDKTHILGAFTSENNKESGIFPVMPVKGDSLIIELFIPDTLQTNYELNIVQIAHDYKDFYNYLNKSKNKRSESCEVNINCEEGEDWQIEKQAVCKIIIGSQACTGTLINNANYDEAPYILTANHCLGSTSDAHDAVFIFNYESEECEGTTASGEQSISGSVFRAGKFDLDFGLVELSVSLPDTYNPYYAGWDAKETSADTSVIIHHPDGDIKKISINNDAVVTGNYGEDLATNAHWLVESWETGSTEKGSSGGSLFDENHRIVGTLTGGGTACSEIINDYFAKLCLAYDTYEDSSKQLKYWLDPQNTGVTYLDGYNPGIPSLDCDAKLYQIVEPEEDLCNQNYITPLVKFINNGLNSLSELDISYKLNNELIETVNWEGELSSNEIESVYFSEIPLSDGVYSFEAFVSISGDQVDEDNDNNTLSVDFTIQTGTLVSLEINTDNYGSETTWELLDSNNNVVYSGGSYTSNQEIYLEFCLPEDLYTFTIYDKDNDGICCNYGSGSYTLIHVSSGDTIATGGEFTDRESVTFSTTLTNIDDKENSIYVTAYPVPVSEIVYITYPQNICSKIEVFDIYGKKIKAITISPATTRTAINFSGYSPGIYFLRVYAEQGFVTSKIVKGR